MMDKRPTTEQLIVATDAVPIRWDGATKRLAEAGTFWLATARPDGRPHVRPVLAVWLDGALHVVSSTSARKTSHLQSRPHCSISTSTGDLDLVIEGSAIRVMDDATLRRVADAYDAKYQWPVEIRDGAFSAEGAPTAGPPPFHIFELIPTTAFGFGTDETFADRSTRWHFSE